MPGHMASRVNRRGSGQAEEMDSWAGGHGDVFVTTYHLLEILKSTKFLIPVQFFSSPLPANHFLKREPKYSILNELLLQDLRIP